MLDRGSTSDTFTAFHIRMLEFLPTVGSSCHYLYDTIRYYILHTSIRAGLEATVHQNLDSNPKAYAKPIRDQKFAQQSARLVHRQSTQAHRSTWRPNAATHPFSTCLRFIIHPNKQHRLPRLMPASRLRALQSPKRPARSPFPK